MATPTPPTFAEDGSEVLGLPKWITIRRETGLVEHVCEHNVGHPNAGSILWMQESTGQDGWGIHGCDGCCQHDDFPGTLKHAVQYCHKLIGERNATIKGLRFDLNLAFGVIRDRLPWWRKLWPR
jgi:hypothetical protein